MAGHIARTAARLFASLGYDATSVRSIVEAAGVTKPTLYYHFGSKEGLAQALLTRPMTQLIEVQRALLDGADDPVRKLVGLVETTFAFCREDADRSRFVYALFFGPLGSSLSAELAQHGAALTSLVEEGVALAAEGGVVDPGRAPACAAALRGQIVIHTMDHLYRGFALGPETAEQVVADLLRGFAAPATAPVASPGRNGPGLGRKRPRSRT